MKPVLIFSGANDRAVIAFCRYAESVSLAYAIVANGKEDLVYLSDYKKNIIAVRKKNILSIEDFLEFSNLVKEKYSANELFVLPSTEYINRFLLRYREIIENEKISFGLCDLKLYAAISDKYAFGNLCKQYEIVLPKEFVERPNSFPYVVKPKSYFNSTQNVSSKPILIYSPECEQQFLTNLNEKEMYYQEYIGGESIYLLFYFFKNKTYSVYSQENFIQQHNGGSMLFCKSTKHHLEESLVAKYVKLFTENDFHGLVMVEVKYYNGTYYMIEANPRLWGPSQLILDSKMTLFDDFSLDNNLIQNPKYNSDDYLNGVTYFWSGGLVETQKNNSELMVYNIKKEDFLQQYSTGIRNEIYQRNDTIQIYLKENS